MAASDPALLATDVAEYLVGKGVPFREAHAIVGELVRRAAEMRVGIDQLSVAQLAQISPQLDAEVLQMFDPRRSLQKRTGKGAPSPENVAKRIAHWRKQLS